MPNRAMHFYVLKNWFCVIWLHLALCTNSFGEALRRNISKKKKKQPKRIPFQKYKQGLSLN